MRWRNIVRNEEQGKMMSSLYNSAKKKTNLRREIALYPSYGDDFSSTRFNSLVRQANRKYSGTFIVWLLCFFCLNINIELNLPVGKMHHFIFLLPLYLSPIKMCLLACWCHWHLHLYIYIYLLECVYLRNRFNFIASFFVMELSFAFRNLEWELADTVKVRAQGRADARSTRTGIGINIKFTSQYEEMKEIFFFCYLSIECFSHNFISSYISLYNNLFSCPISISAHIFSICISRFIFVCNLPALSCSNIEHRNRKTSDTTFR